MSSALLEVTQSFLSSRHIKSGAVVQEDVNLHFRNQLGNEDASFQMDLF